MTRSIPTGFLIALAGAFSAMQILFGALSLTHSSRPGASIAAMAIYAGLTVLVLVPGDRGLSRPADLLLVAGVVAITLLVQSGLPLTGWPSFAAWHTAGIQCLLIVVALRRRLLTAVAGCALFTLLTLLWSVDSAGGIVLGLRMVLAPVLFTLVAIALARFLSINDRRAESRTRQALELLDQAALADAARESALSWARDVAAIAVPSLRLAADPESVLTGDDRDRMLRVEAALRDRIRGGALATPAILAAVAEARGRGAIVRLLDDRGDALGERTVEELTDAITALVPRVRGGTLTIRARPVRSTPPAATIAYVPDDLESAAEHIEF